jgi:putative redox protein
MTTSRIQYLGNLRCEAVHLKSGVSIVTDAPVDNKGKGEAFSPTDLMSTSLGLCMLTIMGIAAEEKNIPMTNIAAEIQKIMGTDPRRVAEIKIKITGDFREWTEREWAIMKKAADTCPVKQSIHPDLITSIEWKQI